MVFFIGCIAINTSMARFTGWSTVCTLCRGLIYCCDPNLMKRELKVMHKLGIEPWPPGQRVNTLLIRPPLLSASSSHCCSVSAAATAAAAAAATAVGVVLSY